MFKVALCPKCAKYQVTLATSQLLCKYCGRSTVFKKANSAYNQIIIKGVFDNGKEAGDFCRKVTSRD